MTYKFGYVKGVGPAAPPGARCPCGRPALCECQGCGVTLCQSHWWRHSHTVRIADDIVPFAPSPTGGRQ